MADETKKKSDLKVEIDRKAGRLITKIEFRNIRFGESFLDRNNVQIESLTIEFDSDQSLLDTLAMNLAGIMSPNLSEN